MIDEDIFLQNTSLLNDLYFCLFVTISYTEHRGSHNTVAPNSHCDKSKFGSGGSGYPYYCFLTSSSVKSCLLNFRGIAVRNLGVTFT